MADKTRTPLHSKMILTIRVKHAQLKQRSSVGFQVSRIISTFKLIHDVETFQKSV